MPGKFPLIQKAKVAWPAAAMAAAAGVRLALFRLNNSYTLINI